MLIRYEILLFVQIGNYYCPINVKYTDIFALYSFCLCFLFLYL
jgi:hypothetical protein